MENTYNIGIPDFIARTYSIFYLLGLWNTKDGVNMWQYFCFIYYGLLLLSVYIGAFIAETDDDKVFLIVITFIGLVQMCRLYYIIWKQEEVIKLTHESGISSTHDNEVFNDCMEKSGKMMILSRLYNLILFSSFIAVIFLPLCSSERHLIFNIAFPFDYKHSEAAFWTAYFFVLIGFFLSLICCVYAYVVWYLMLNMIIKYEILGSQFKTVGTFHTKKITPSEQSKLYLEQLIKPVTEHENTFK